MTTANAFMIIHKIGLAQNINILYVFSGCRSSKVGRSPSSPRPWLSSPFPNGNAQTRVPHLNPTPQILQHSSWMTMRCGKSASARYCRKCHFEADQHNCSVHFMLEFETSVAVLSCESCVRRICESPADDEQ